MVLEYLQCLLEDTSKNTNNSIKYSTKPKYVSYISDISPLISPNKGKRHVYAYTHYSELCISVKLFCRDSKTIVEPETLVNNMKNKWIDFDLLWRCFWQSRPSKLNLSSTVYSLKIYDNFQLILQRTENIVWKSNLLITLSHCWITFCDTRQPLWHFGYIFRVLVKLFCSIWKKKQEIGKNS